MKLRIEIDEMGRTIMILPEDLVEDFQIDKGDIVTAQFPEEQLMLVDFGY